MSPWLKGGLIIAAYCALLWCLMRLFRLNGDFDGAASQQAKEVPYPNSNDDTGRPVDAASKPTTPRGEATSAGAVPPPNS